MSDFADLAAEREQEIRDDALAAQKRRHPAAAETAETCAICAEPIPVARQQALPGVQTCIDCERELEQALMNRARRSLRSRAQ